MINTWEMKRPGGVRGQEEASEPRQHARADNTLVGLIQHQLSSQIAPEFS